MRTKILSALAGSLLVVVLVPGTAWAPKVLSPVVGAPCEVAGTPGVYEGTAEIHSVTASPGLVATGWAEGTCETTEGSVLGTVSGDQTLRVEAGVARASCKEIRLRLSETAVGDVTLDFSDVTVAALREGPRDRSLCSVARLYRQGDIDGFAKDLSEYL